MSSAPAVVKLFYGVDANTTVRIVIALVAAAVVVVAVYISKRRPIAVGDPVDATV